MELDSARFPRTVKLAMPLARNMSKKYVKPRRWKFSSGVSPSAKTYKITKRILELSLPSPRLMVSTDPEIEPGVVEEKALKSTASKRIKILAIPRKRVGDIHSRRHPFRISRRALKYKATKRIKMLAIPLYR